MITRLQIENYRSIRRLDLRPGPTGLLMGANGTGKTSVFDVLAAIRGLVIDGVRCDEAFQANTFPRWLEVHNSQSNILNIQRFAVTILYRDTEFTYTVAISHRRYNDESRVQSETLTENEEPLFNYSDGSVRLYRDDHGQGGQYAFDGARSALASVPDHPLHSKMTWFKERLARIHSVRLDAPRMSGRSERGEAAPDRGLSNFAPWLVQAWLDDSAAAAAMQAALRAGLPGFDSMKFDSLGEGRYLLKVRFNAEATPAADGGPADDTPAVSYSLNFSELSDGQRAIIGLHALLHFLVRADTTLCIDEPDNYVSLGELQPLLLDFMDKAEETGGQILFASHHPEYLNLLAIDHGLVFRRDRSGTTTASQFQAPPDVILPAAEYFARGMDGDA